MNIISEPIIPASLTPPEDCAAAAAAGESELDDVVKVLVVEDDQKYGNPASRTDRIRRNADIASSDRA